MRKQLDGLSSALHDQLSLQAPGHEDMGTVLGSDGTRVFVMFDNGPRKIRLPRTVDQEPPKAGDGWSIVGGHVPRSRKPGPQLAQSDQAILSELEDEVPRARFPGSSVNKHDETSSMPVLDDDASVSLFCECGMRVLINCASTCRRWRDLIMTQDVWASAYMFQLRSLLCQAFICALPGTLLPEFVSCASLADLRGFRCNLTDAQKLRYQTLNKEGFAVVNRFLVLYLCEVMGLDHTEESTRGVLGRPSCFMLCKLYFRSVVEGDEADTMEDVAPLYLIPRLLAFAQSYATLHSPAAAGDPRQRMTLAKRLQISWIVKAFMKMGSSTVQYLSSSSDYLFLVQLFTFAQHRHCYCRGNGSPFRFLMSKCSMRSVLRHTCFVQMAQSIQGRQTEAGDARHEIDFADYEV